MAKITPISTDRRPDARRHSSDSGPLRATRPPRPGRGERTAIRTLRLFKGVEIHSCGFYIQREQSNRDGRFPSRVRLASHVATRENEESGTSLILFYKRK